MLRARLYNKKTTADVKRSAKMYGYGDLIIVPYIDMDGASAKVTKDLVKAYGVTEKTVIDTAIKNTEDDFEIKSMREIMKEMMQVDDEMFEAMFPVGEPPMYVITNSKRFYGAISVISAQDKLEELFPDGYAIIPSSVHEVLAIPLSDEVDEQMLKGMIGEVNATEVAAEEVLGSRAYIFKEVEA